MHRDTNASEWTRYVMYVSEWTRYGRWTRMYKHKHPTLSGWVSVLCVVGG